MLNLTAKEPHAVRPMARKAKKSAAQKIPDPVAKDDGKVLQIRLDGPLNKRYDDACAKVKLARSVLGEIIVEAVVELIERDGKITVPLKVQPLDSVPVV